MNILTIDCDWAISGEKLLTLLDFCFKKFDKNKEVIFIEEHHHIINFINKNDILFNIDHHHDVSYNDSFKKIIENNECAQGNWVFALIYKNIINKYYWICNEDSSYEQKDVLDLLNSLEIFVKSTNLNTLNKFTFDKIIICKSEQYLKNANITFKIIQNMCDNISIPYKTFNMNNPNSSIKL